MKIVFKSLVFVGSLLFAFSVDFVDRTSPIVTFVSEAEAFRGLRGRGRRAERHTSPESTASNSSAPLTSGQPDAQPLQQPATQAAPAVAIGTVVQALPGGCTPVVARGVSYSNCGDVFYRAAFQGSNLVYVVVEKPLK